MTKKVTNVMFDWTAVVAMIALIAVASEAN